jgi:hypothetical protein
VWWRVRCALWCEILVQICSENTWKEETECARNDNIGIKRNEIINKMYRSVQSNTTSIV